MSDAVRRVRRRRVVVLAARRHRHRSDHPGALPQGAPTSAGLGEHLFADWRTRRAPRLPAESRPTQRRARSCVAGAQLRLRLVARARAVGARRLRASARSSRARSPTSSAATRSRTACCRSRSTTRRTRALVAARAADPALALDDRPRRRRPCGDCRAIVRVRLRDRSVRASTACVERRRRARLPAGVRSIGSAPHERRQPSESEETAMKATIVVLPGDGIGPEVVRRGAAGARGRRRARTATSSRSRRIRSAASRSTRPAIRCRRRRSSACQRGRRGPARRRRRAEVGRSERRRLRPEQGLLGLRKALGLFANLRPVRGAPGAGGGVAAEADAARGRRPPVRARADRRALLRPAAAARGRPMASGAPSTRSSTREDEIERVVRARRSGWRAADAGRLTSVDKANVLESSRLWREVAIEVAAGISRTSRSSTSSSTRARCGS